MKTTYYELLGVEPHASIEDIREAYLKKVKEYHPDVYVGDRVKAADITADLNTAYATLKDSTKRKEYDKSIGVNNIKQNKKESGPKYRQDTKQKQNKKKVKNKKPSPKDKNTKDHNSENDASNNKDAKSNNNELHINERLVFDGIIVALIVVIILLIVFR